MQIESEYNSEKWLFLERIFSSEILAARYIADRIHLIGGVEKIPTIDKKKEFTNFIGVSENYIRNKLIQNSQFQLRDLLDMARCEYKGVTHIPREVYYNASSLNDFLLLFVDRAVQLRQTGYFYEPQSRLPSEVSYIFGQNYDIYPQEIGRIIKERKWAITPEKVEKAARQISSVICVLDLEDKPKYRVGDVIPKPHFINKRSAVEYFATVLKIKGVGNAPSIKNRLAFSAFYHISISALDRRKEMFAGARPSDIIDEAICVAKGIDHIPRQQYLECKTQEELELLLLKRAIQLRKQNIFNIPQGSRNDYRIVSKSFVQNYNISPNEISQIIKRRRWKLLTSRLERYLEACSEIADYYYQVRDNL